MTPNQLSEAIVAALRALVAAGSLELEVPSEVVVERPKNREHGDWATNVAMQLGAKAGLKPRDFAELLSSELQKSAGIEKVEIAGPGFINLFVHDSIVVFCFLQHKLFLKLLSLGDVPKDEVINHLYPINLVQVILF